MTDWDGDMNAPHTMQDEYEYARANGWAEWTTDEDGQMVCYVSDYEEELAGILSVADRI